MRFSAISKEILLLFAVLLMIRVMAQDPVSTIISREDSLYFSNLPVYTIPSKYLHSDGKDLPYYLDNSVFSCFPPIVDQNGWECAQVSTIGYVFTYELNRLRKLPSSSDENRYPTNFTLNLYNEGIWEKGVNFYHSFEAIMSNGHPTIADFGINNESYKRWMSGYEKYYHAMHNRLDGVYSFYIGDYEGITHLKYWLWDHMEQSDTGGLATVYLRFDDITTLAPGTPEEGKSVVTGLLPYPGHAVTIVGYNDSICYDYNNDGLFTTNMDINGDDMIDLHDREKGAFIVANSYGPDWSNDGFVYMMYKTAAGKIHEPGIWNKAAYVLDVEPGYEPLLTCRIKLAHTSRNKIKIEAGFSSDTSAYAPDHILDFPFLHYRGGNFPMQGDESVAGCDTIELGLDLTPLLSYTNSGQKSKFFIQITENDFYNQGMGSVISAQLIDYANGYHEIPFPFESGVIPGNGTLSLSAIHASNQPKVEILDKELPAFGPGEPYTYQLNAGNGTPPLNWNLVKNYTVAVSQVSYPETTGTELLPGEWNLEYVRITLPFGFPLYGKMGDSIYVHRNGFVIRSLPEYDIPYYVSDLTMLRFFSMVAPFISYRMYFREDSDDRLIRKEDENSLSLRWIMTQDTLGEQVEVDFTLSLYPDGKIRYYFKDPAALAGLSHLSGISAGNGDLYQVLGMPHSSSPLMIELTPADIPDGLQLSNNGILTAQTAESGILKTLPVKVTDNNGISDYADLQFSDGINCAHSAQGGTNSLIESGEWVNLGFRITNTGAEAMSKAVLLLKKEDEEIILGDSTEVTGIVLPGDSIFISSAFTFKAPDELQDDQLFSFTACISTGEKDWEYPFKLRGSAPAIKLTEIQAGTEGRPFLAQGITDTLVIKIANTGRSDATEVNVVLGCDDERIELFDPEIIIPALLHGEEKVLLFPLLADPSCPSGLIVNFNLSVQAQPAYSFSTSASFPVDKTPVLIYSPLSGNTSGYILVHALDSLGIYSDLTFALPDHPEAYSSLFVLLGRKFDQHILSPSEGTILANYLEQGGNLYMEGGLTWFDDPSTAVHPMFQTIPVHFGWHERGPVAGDNNSFASALFFNYESDMMYYNYYLLPSDSSFVYLYDENSGYGCAVAYPGENYKTLASTLEFGALKGIENDTAPFELAKEYMKFFGILSSNQIFDHEGNVPGYEISLKIRPNPSPGPVVFEFTLSNPAITEIKIFNAGGVEMCTPLTGTLLHKGQHTVEYDLTVIPGKIQPGVYLAVLRSGSVLTRSKLVILP